MRLIHCTRKLLKEFKVIPVDLTTHTQDSEGLGNWYANLLRTDKRKCILFTNGKTLYSFLIPRVVKSNLQNIKNEFLTHLTFNLQNEGFDLAIIDKVRQEYREIGFATTINRAVLGSMTDFTFQYKFLIIRDGGLENANILKINRTVNQSPMSVLRYRYPIEALKMLLAK